MTIGLEEARRLVEREIQEFSSERPVTTYRVVETPRSWIFEWGSVSGEPMLGNVPIVVDKRSGGLATVRTACLEFESELSPWRRVRRWWSRTFEY